MSDPSNDVSAKQPPSRLVGKRRYFLILILLLASLLGGGVVVSVTVLMGGETIAHFVAVEGDVSVTGAASDDWEPAKIGDGLAVDNRVRTGHDGSAVIAFLGGCRLGLESDSEVELASVVATAAPRNVVLSGLVLRVLRGSVRGVHCTRPNYTVEIGDAEGFLLLEPPKGSARIQVGIGPVSMVSMEKGEGLLLGIGEPVSLKEGDTAALKVGGIEIVLPIGTDDVEPPDELVIGAIIIGATRVEVKRGKKGGWARAVGMVTIQVGDRIRSTTKVGLVRVGEDVTVKLAPGTEMVVARSTAEEGRRAEISLGLERGRVTWQTRKSKQALSLSISSDGAAATVTTDMSASGWVALGNDRILESWTNRGSTTLTGKGKKLITAIDTGGYVPVGGKPVGPIGRPGPPALKKPASGESFLGKESAPAVGFAWGESKFAADYHLYVGRTRQLKRRSLWNGRISGLSTTHHRLPTGKLYWTVVGVNMLDVEGQPAKPRVFNISSDNKGPRLEIIEPAADITTRQSSFTVKACTERSADARINGKSMKVGKDGCFETKIELRKGTNRVLVEAIDLAGNVRYEHRRLRRE